MNQPKKFGGRNAEAACYCHDVQEADIAFAALHPSDVVAVEMGEFCQFFLRKTALQPEPADFIAKRFTRILRTHLFMVRCGLLEFYTL